VSLTESTEFRNEFTESTSETSLLPSQLGEGEQTLKLGRVSELTREFDYHA